MKELTIEEKAERFDEVLAMAKECITYVPDDNVVIKKGEKPTAWSEEDEKLLNDAISLADECDDIELRDWLKSIKDRVGCEVNCTTTKRWSEEDIRAIDRACVALRAYSNGELPNFLPSELLGYADRLQSLIPQNTWKPSDGQMKALNYVVNLMASSESPKENDYYYNVFKDLREQLKKLREE